jgi:alpha-L-rhamnosidase
VCLPHGGTSAPKLLGAYKLFVNGKVVGIGPGRRVNATQGVDAVDVTGVLVDGRNALGIQSYHSNNFKDDAPRVLLQLTVTFEDGSTQTLSTGTDWHTMDARTVFNPYGECT